jgi:hypothetical protein
MDNKQYARLRLRELVRGTREIRQDDQGVLTGRTDRQPDETESWECWWLYQELTTEERDDIKAAVDSDGGWYTGPGRGFAHAPTWWDLPSGALLVIQHGGLDV